MSDLDEIDLRILSLLQENAKVAIAELTHQCGASSASVQRRLSKLRKSGVIKREVAEIDRHVVGFSVKAIVFVELERDGLTEVNTFKQRVKNEPHVQNCYCIAGNADFVLTVVAKDISNYEQFAEDFFFSDPNIKKYRSAIVLSEQKCSNTLPLVSET